MMTPSYNTNLFGNDKQRHFIDTAHNAKGELCNVFYYSSDGRFELEPIEKAIHPLNNR